MTPTAILLFNLGGPDDLASVEPFLVNLFSDREIIELPLGAALQPVFARVIARLRGPSVRRNYERIGGGSPQLRITRAQAEALEERLNLGQCGTQPFRVFIAMRYTRPTCEDALRAIANAGIRRIATLARPEWRALNLEVTHVDRYAADPRYLDAMAESVNRAWDGIPVDRRGFTVLLFSAHGLPQKF